MSVGRDACSRGGWFFEDFERWIAFEHGSLLTVCLSCHSTKVYTTPLVVKIWPGSHLRHGPLNLGYRVFLCLKDLKSKTGPGLTLRRRPFANRPTAAPVRTATHAVVTWAGRGPFGCCFWKKYSSLAVVLESVLGKTFLCLLKSPHSFRSWPYKVFRRGVTMKTQTIKLAILQLHIPIFDKS
jgi:hypothetical protein